MSSKPKSPPKLPTRLPVPVEIAENTEAKREWVRVVRVLDNKLDERDHNLMLDYCMTHAEIIDLRIQVEAEGKTLQGPKGGMYINPILNVLISRQAHLAALRRDLYFTPKSRIEKTKRANLTPGQAIRGELDDDNGGDED